MDSIEWAGLISFLFCVVFTLFLSHYEAPTGGQTPRESMHEAWHNILVGYPISYLGNMLVLPLATEGLTFWNNFLIGWVFTAISIARSYCIRRWHNRKTFKNK